jgi:hypothetical protein
MTMNVRQLGAFLGVLCGATCLLLPAQSADQTEDQWGVTTQGLQMSLSDTGQGKPGEPEFQVAFRNVGQQDVVLNLGMMLANGKVLLPDKIRLKLTDAAGKTRELHFSDKRYPGVAGRVDDYLVPLRAGSVYSLRLPLDQFWSPSTQEFTLKLPPGKYQASAQFQGSGAATSNDDMPGIKLMNFWKGKLTSNDLTLEP